MRKAFTLSTAAVALAIGMAGPAAAQSFGTVERGSCANGSTRTMWARYYEVNVFGSAIDRCKSTRGYRDKTPDTCRRDALGAGIIAEWRVRDGSCAAPSPPPPTVIEAIEGTVRAVTGQPDPTELTTQPTQRTQVMPPPGQTTAVDDRNRGLVSDVRSALATAQTELAAVTRDVSDGLAALDEAVLKPILTDVKEALEAAVNAAIVMVSDQETIDAFNATVAPHEEQIRLALALSERLTNPQDAAGQAVVDAIKARDGSAVMANLAALPEWTRYTAAVARANPRYGPPGEVEPDKPGPYERGCSASMILDGYHTLTIGLSGDFSVIGGLGGEMGVAITDLEDPCTNGEPYFYSTFSRALGLSGGVSAGVAVGSWRGPNWCQFGEGGGVVLAGGAGLDGSVGLYYSSPEAMEKFLQTHELSTGRNYDFDLNAPENRWRRSTGLVVAVSGGFGAEILEHNWTTTVQSPRQALLNECQEINDVRRTWREECGDNPDLDECSRL